MKGLTIPAVYFAPSNIPQEFLLHHPVEILPDGNCFFRSLSWLVYGTGDKHIDMRSRIMINSVVNFTKYTDHSYLMQNAANTHNKCNDICEYYCAYCGETNVGKRDKHMEGIKFVLKEDIMRITFEKRACRHLANTFSCKMPWEWNCWWCFQTEILDLMWGLTWTGYFCLKIWLKNVLDLCGQALAKMYQFTIT